MPDNQYKQYYSFQEAEAQIDNEFPQEILLTMLKEGTIEAEGRLFDPNATSGRHDEPLPAGEHHIVKPIYWDDWEFNEIKMILINKEDQSQYTSIRINKANFLKIIDKKLDLSKGGRPQKYDEKKFFAELAGVINLGDFKPENLPRPIPAEERRNLFDLLPMLKNLDSEKRKKADKSVQILLADFFKHFDETK